MMHTISESGSSPLLSKAKLATVAVGAVVAYHLAVIAPVAVVLMANPWTARMGPWPILATLAILWWVMQPKTPTHGKAVSRDQAPALFEAVDALADKIDAPRIDDIHLDDSFNAGAMEAPGRWPLWRRRRVLVLGVPLLALADADMVRGVIAHEFGHFSHRHGRLGHWVYRARVGWLDYAEAVPQEAPLYWRAPIAFARWFTPRFARMSARYSRQCEFEADAVGASAVGAQVMAAGLLTIAVLGDRWAQDMQTRVPKLIATHPLPPASWLAEVQGAVLTQPPQQAEWERLRTRLSNENDTHPSLGERVHALGVDGGVLLSTLSQPQRPAGQAWLPNWPAIVAAYDADWAHQHAPRWRCAHIHHRHASNHLAALRANQDASIERARLERSHGVAADAESLARPWQEDPAHAAEAAYLIGAARLEAGDPVAGIASLEACISHDPAWAAPGSALIERHAGAVSDAETRSRNRALLLQACQRRERVQQRMLDAILKADLLPAALEPLAEQVMREALAEWDVVAGAWCAACSNVEIDGRRFNAVALILRLRTEALQTADLDEDHVRAQALALLDDVLSPSTVKLVWTVYTTEHLSPELHARLEAWAAPGHPGCLVRPVAGESVGPGTRAMALG